MQAQGCGLKRGGTSQVFGVTQKGQSALRVQATVILPLVWFIRHRGTGLWGPGGLGQAPQIHLDGLNADGWGKDGHVTGAASRSIQSSGDEGIPRGRYVLRVLRWGKRRVGGGQFSSCCPSSLCFFLKRATRASHMSHPDYERCPRHCGARDCPRTAREGGA